LLSDRERNILFQSHQQVYKYDFHIANYPYIKDSSGKFFQLTFRCWTILSQVIHEPLDFLDAENLLNSKSDKKDEKKYIVLDGKAIEYIVSKTNSVLRAARSAYRLSARGSSFSLR
jgi:hypothetical protein